MLDDGEPYSPLLVPRKFLDQRQLRLAQQLRPNHTIYRPKPRDYFQSHLGSSWVVGGIGYGGLTVTRQNQAIQGITLIYPRLEERKNQNSPSRRWESSSPSLVISILCCSKNNEFNRQLVPKAKRTRGVRSLSAGRPLDTSATVNTHTRTRANSHVWVGVAQEAQQHRREVVDRMISP